MSQNEIDKQQISSARVKNIDIKKTGDFKQRSNSGIESASLRFTENNYESRRSGQRNFQNPLESEYTVNTIHNRIESIQMVEQRQESIPVVKI